MWDTAFGGAGIVRVRVRLGVKDPGLVGNPTLGFLAVVIFHFLQNYAHSLIRNHELRKIAKSQKVPSKNGKTHFIYNGLPCPGKV